MEIIPIIMAGGSGTRLWPLSRALFPKQFLALHGERTMLQETVQRLDGLYIAGPCIICNEEHRFVVAEQLREQNVKAGAIILEPVGRNTAPAIALAALKARGSGGEDPVLLVLAADHVIEDADAFRQTMVKAVAQAEQGKLVTFGIVVHKPETGYGYIKRGKAMDEVAFQVDSFKEKPDEATAQGYLDSGEYYWNSGMFMFRANRYLEELGRHRPDILKACEAALKGAKEDLDFIRVDKEAFSACPDESVDYAVMENTDDAVVVPLDAGWSDVGSWSALWEVDEKDTHGNAFRGDVILEDTENCLVHATEKLVATVGLKDTVIVETKDAVLVAAKDKVHEVKRIVERLKDADRSEFKHHRQVYRPWGHYDSIGNGDRYQVKCITVKPGAKLSVQMHHHRAEHWIVVSGTAKVTIGDKTFLVTENESTYIPVGIVHALENPGKVPLELIEVQSGSYLGEDDIVRFEDRYGRA
jgi:mannose-1-phosphate guanylyltransferase/mannose-6-phosphate isomerase